MEKRSRQQQKIRRATEKKKHTFQFVFSEINGLRDSSIHCMRDVFALLRIARFLRLLFTLRDQWFLFFNSRTLYLRSFIFWKLDMCFSTANFDTHDL